MMNLYLHSFVLIWGISIILILPECDDDKKLSENGCTEIGCSDGFALIIQPTDSLLPEGIYDITLYNQGIGSSSCSFRVSNDSNECASGHCVVEESCNALYMVGYPKRDRVAISYPVLSGSAQVSIKRNNTNIFQANFIPEYEYIQPNGPGCPPICKVGSKTIILE